MLKLILGCGMLLTLAGAAVGPAVFLTAAPFVSKLCLVKRA